MNDFFLFFGREAKLANANLYYYLLPLFFWLTGFFLLRLGLPALNMNDDRILFSLLWFLLLVFFSLATMGSNLYQADNDSGLAIDIMAAGRSLLALVYAKAGGLLVFSGLPLWLATMGAFLLLGVGREMMVILLVGGFLFLAQVAFFINFLASLTPWGRGAGFFMVIIILPLALPCFIFVLSMATSHSLTPVVFFQLAYFILCFSFLPMASAFIIKQES